MAQPGDPHDLARFVAAQHGVIDSALAELRAGTKRTHWMWFVFPQLAALGRSATAKHYGIADAAEARAYLAHPLLGPRLLACTAAACSTPGRSLHAIFGSPDDLKFVSSMTLFEAAAPTPEAAAPLARALEHHCGGARDALTLRLLGPD